MNSACRRVVSPAVASFVVAASSALAASLSSHNNASVSASCQQKEEERKRPKLVFLGTGSSTGCPKPLCTMLFQHDGDDYDKEQQSEVQREFRNLCRVSNRAIQGDPRHNKDYRNNPSILISHYPSAAAATTSYDGEASRHQEHKAKNIVIDVGKTFREGALRWFPTHDIESLDAVILTHHHMDAVAGLDDLRGFQRFRGLNRKEPPTRIPIDVFLSQECFDQVSLQFPFLFPKKTTISDAATPVVKRDVAALDVHLIDNYQPFEAAGLKLIPLPVWHGSDLVCLGFAFSIQGEGGGSSSSTNVLYISDISQMIPETMDYIRTKLPPTDILIVDCLLPEFQHPVHFNLYQAVDLAREVKAKRTYLVGMSCDGFPPHDDMNEQLAKDYGSSHGGDGGGTIQFAYDGQVLHL